MRRLALLLCCLSLGAADFSGGFGLAKAFPLGPVKDDPILGTHNSNGSSGEIHFEWQLGRREALRLRFTNGQFEHPETVPLDTGVTLSTTWDAIGWGLDWRHDFAGPQRGGYTLVGLGLSTVEASATLRWETPYGLVGNTSTVRQHNRLAWRVGAGYHLNRFFDLEASYHEISTEPHGTEGLRISKLQWIEVGLTVSFGKGR